ncbi:MAG TPA: prolyl oligopeptidase family serine peptidase, partial [Prolixibacteraceae bacterium]|nr:prolyl oligopeptidase family serine peptidase [Prolixibacteraceae bacterium]
MMKTLKFPLVMTLASLLLVFGCKEDEEPEEFKPKYLVESEKILTIQKSNLETIVGAAGLSEFASQLEYDVDVYKLTYKTEFEGDTIEVSGIVSYPVNSDQSFDMISYQHGTIFTNASAPSVYFENAGYITNQQNEAFAGVFMASMGNVVAIADYIGFGESSTYLHPYMHKEYTNNAVLDMIRASKEYAKQEDACNINKNLFLLGFSQGGSATVAALSAIENNTDNSDIKVKAVAAGSGAYNLMEFRKFIINKEPRFYETPSFILYIIDSYKLYSDMDVEYSAIFSDPYAQDVVGLIDGNTYANTIEEELSNYVGELFNDDFEDHEIFMASDTYAPVREAFVENTVNAWDVQTPLNLYHGNDDQWVPATQSSLLFREFTTTYQSSNVSLKPFEGLDHTGAFFPTIAASL